MLVCIHGQRGVWRIVRAEADAVVALSYIDGQLLHTPLLTLLPVPDMTITDDRAVVITKDAT
jgi:hypothetical protein